MVYLKSGAAILEFGLAELIKARFASGERARVIKSVRNDVNRQTNAEIRIRPAANAFPLTSCTRSVWCWRRTA